VAGEALVDVLVMAGGAQAIGLLGGGALIVHDMAGGAVDILVLHVRRQVVGVHYQAVLIGASGRFGSERG